ncbi:hypothetical protein HDU78_005366 [Chytriomyces hyalinus]|uniref:Rhomboid-type serine protease n=1 Tax=Chytriomyces confervae TaxID=246404 RepID=A0A507FSF6_9FUNG|nr:hypothetical protein HDU78_005366 [Chytriomyces hyalinus]TPX78278.1 hypothetical protein CcCBS67573_g00476 [Chytriomyces confervae]
MDYFVTDEKDRRSQTAAPPPGSMSLGYHNGASSSSTLADGGNADRYGFYSNPNSHTPSMHEGSIDPIVPIKSSKASATFMQTSADTVVERGHKQGAGSDLELARRIAAIDANAPRDAPDGEQLHSTLHSPYVRKQLAELKVHRPYFLWTVTFAQVVLMIVELIVNLQRTGSLIETNPFNYMIGPSSGIIIHTGGRFTPCIRPNTGYDKPGMIFACPAGVPGTPQRQGGSTIQVCTLDQLCGMGGLNGQPPNQWYRFIVPIFLHGGLVHLAMNLVFQCKTGFQMEQDFGWWRMALIYMISGVGGFIFGGNYSGMSPSVGCSGALFGLIACLLIDLMQNWRLVKNPGWELAKLIFLILVSFLLGTLPYLDNFAHIGGFFCGFLAGLIFMPTIYYTKTDKIVKITLQAIAVPLLIGVFALMITGFYNVSNSCPWCKYLTCIPGMPWCEQKWNQTLAYVP